MILASPPPRYLLEVKKANPRPHHMQRVLDIESVKKQIGSTWMDVEDNQDRIIFDTRQNGDVGASRPGKPDIDEARRLAGLLKKSFPYHEVGLDVVDEWVLVDIKKKPKSREKILHEKYEEKTKSLTAKWAPHVARALDAASAKVLGENSQKKNHARPFFWKETVLPGKEFGMTSFGANYGTRRLYRDHHGAIPAFETPEQASSALKIILSSLGGELKSERIGKPYAKETYNYPPPNNIIEEVGTVIFDVQLPAKPPTKARSLGKPSITPSVTDRRPSIGK